MIDIFIKIAYNINEPNIGFQMFVATRYATEKRSSSNVSLILSGCISA